MKRAGTGPNFALFEQQIMATQPPKAGVIGWNW